MPQKSIPSPPHFSPTKRIFPIIGKEENVSEEKLEIVTKEFLNKAAELFTKNQMCVNRAIIASTLAVIPNFFHSVDEVQEYVQQSIEQCTDAAERQASMNIINNIIKGMV